MKQSTTLLAFALFMFIDIVLVFTIIISVLGLIAKLASV